MYIGRLHNFLVGGAKKGITTTLGIFLALAIAANTALIPTKVHAATALQATEASITDKSATASAEIVTTDGNSITDGTTIRSKVTFTKANDFVTYRVRIDNVTDKAYTVEAITDDNTSANVTYEYDQHAGATLPVASAFYFDVTARYVATPSLDDRNQSINVRFHFTLKDVETGEEVEEELLIVPDTGTSEQAEEIANAKRQNLILYFDIAVFIIIVVALIVKFTKNKKAKLIIPIVALIGTATGFIVSAAEFPFELIIASEYSYKDRLAVTYDIDGEEQVIAVSNGDTLEGKIEDPSKTGYTFTGWLDENNEPVDLTQPIEDDTKIHAAFTPISYILHIDIDDDYNFALTVPLKYDEEYTLPEVDHSLWYIDEYHYGWFDDGPDWSTEEDDHYYTVGQVVKNLATVDGAEIWLETEWRPRILTATYLDFYDDELVAQLPTEVSYVYFDDHGGEIPLPHPLEREGYRLKWFEINGHPQYQGLYPDYLEDEDTYTVKAVWEKKVLNICYRVYGRVDEFEGQTECDSVEYGEEYEVRENYFIHYGHDAVEGWSTTPAGTTIAYAFGATLDPNSYINDCGNINYCELSLYAIWTPRTTTLHFTPGDGVTDATGTVPDVTFTYGQPAALDANNVFKRPGYTLSSWNCGDAGTYAPYFTADGWTYYATYEATCKANWDANRYHIQFEPNADDTTGQMTGITAFYGGDTNLTPNSFERTGYTFAGWKKDNAGDLIADRSSAGQFAVSSGAIVKLYAQWTPIHYSIVFDKNDDAAQGSMENQSIAYDEPTVLRENTFTREHYKFMGWNTQADGTGTSYTDKAEVTNLASEEGATITLYAQWKERTATLIEAWKVHFNHLDNIIDSPKVFTHYNGTEDPDFESIDNERIISTADSNFPVYAWGIDDTIYWWSEAERPNLNADSSQFFYNEPTYETIDLCGLNFSTVSDAFRMFENTTNLKNLPCSDEWVGTNLKTAKTMFASTGMEELNLKNLITADTTDIDLQQMFRNSKVKTVNTDNWDTSNVVNMSNVFTGTPIESLNLTHWNTENVKNMSGLFAYMKQLTSLDISNWNTANVTNASEMFFTVTNMTEIDVTSFDTSKVENFYRMFAGSGQQSDQLVTIYASEKFVTTSRVAQTGGDQFGNFRPNIVGGAGTTYKNYANDIERARFDDPCNGNPGYFTWKDHRYICFHANYEGSTETAGQYLSTTELGTLRKNTFTRDGFKFLGWKDADGNEYTDEQVMADLVESKTPLELYAQWKELTAMLNTGSNVNTALKAINADATAFTHYTTGTPDFSTIDGEQDIALTTSNFPVYAWNDNGTIYWWSEADDVYMNQNSSYLFNDLASIQSIDLRSLIASNVQKMNNMFENDVALTSINVSEIDTGNVTTMRAMFIRCTSLNTLDFSKFDTSNVEDIQSIFKETAFTELDLSSWDTSSLTNAVTPFPAMPNLEKLDLSGWDLSKITHGFKRVIAEHSAPLYYPSTAKSQPKTIILDRVLFPSDMSGSFENLSVLESISFEQADFSNVSTMNSLFKGCSVLSSINFTDIIVSNALNDMAYMFYNVDNIESIDLSMFDVSNVTNMSFMFGHDMQNFNSKLVTVNIEGWDTAKLEDIRAMFIRSVKLQNIDFSNLNVENVSTMEGTFKQMYAMEEFDLSSWDTRSVINMTAMFSGIHASKIYVSNLFSTSAVTSHENMFELIQNLSGGAGTVWNSSMSSDLAYASIDDPDNSRPGLFSLKDARYIRYDANEPYGETVTGQTQSHYASSVAPYTQVQTNGFAIDGYRFLGWGTSPDSVVVYEPGALIDDINASKEPYTLYAKWEQVVPPTLMQSMLNDKLKEIVAAAGATDNDVVAVKEATNPPAEQLIDDNVISSPESSYKIWAYYTEGTIWIYTEDGLTPHAPDMLGNMLSDFPNLTDVSWLSKLDVSNTTDISSLFDQDTSLADISPLANWDTSKLISILGTFRGTAISDLSPIATKSCGDKTCWDTSNLEEISSAFQRMTNLSDLSPLATWNVSKLNDLNFAFYDTGSLTDFSGISGWRLKTTEDITMLMTFDNRDADYSVLENWFSERTNGTEGLSMSSAFPNIDSTKLPSWAQ